MVDDQPVKRETRKAAIPKQNDADFSTTPAVVEFFQWRGALIRHVACGLHHTLAVAWEPASAGAGVVVCWAMAASLVPLMSKGNDAARYGHMSFNLLALGLFTWQLPTGWGIMLKVIKFTKFP